MGKKSREEVLRFIENLTLNTRKSYNTAITQYEQYHNSTIEELVCEALEEQTQQVPPHLLKIIDRIEGFQAHLVGKELCRSSIQSMVGKIKRIYTKNRVVLPYLEPLRQTEGRKREYIEYKDILTKAEIKKALIEMKPMVKARAMVIAQSGASNEECEHFITRAFIDELYKYHQCDNDVDALKWLANEHHPVIWVTKLIRQKTHKPYYVLVSPESVNAIASAKLHELTLPKFGGKLSPKLLSITKRGFADTLKRINNKLRFGKVAEEVKLRPHMLRKFHATNINGSALTYEEHSMISYQEIDEMQGRGKTSVQDTYIKSNPLKQKLLYAKVMNNVMFYHQYDYEIMGNDVIVTLTDPNIEKSELENEVRKLKKQLDAKNKASEKVNALREELGDDVFKEMINEILTTS